MTSKDAFLILAYKDFKTIEETQQCVKVLEKDLNKLSQLEDIESELGIDLITLFKAKEIYWRIRYIDTNEYSEIKLSKQTYIDLNKMCLKVYDSEWDDFGFDLDLRDYGKTWALTRKWLEK